MKTLKLTISDGNTKLGRIPNLSLPPVTSCRPDAPCANRGECYALTPWRMYPNTRKAWGGNLNYWMSQPQEFEIDFCDWLSHRKPELFRIHVGGDMPDEAYFRMLLRVATRFPDTKFLMFTKRYEYFLGITARSLPKNLSVILSAWPGLDIPTGLLSSDFPVAWVEDDARAPAEGFHCEGKCIDCRECWGRRGGAVVLKRH